jgi:hypothetical protein
VIIMTHSGFAVRAEGAVRGGFDAAAALRTTLSRGHRRPEDTPEGCRALAAADLRRAAASARELSNWRYEHSAAAWRARADLLDRREAKLRALEARKSA